MSKDFTVPRDEFMEMQMGPDGSDVMNFTLRGEKPERFLSVEGIQSLTDQIRDFVMARAVAAYEATGEMPENVNVSVKLDWSLVSDEALEFMGLPWFGGDDKGPTPIDGDSRVQAARRAVKARGQKG